MSPRGGGGGGRPTPGKEYKVNRDDQSLEEIETGAYGADSTGQSSGPLMAALGKTNSGVSTTKLKAGDRLIIPGSPPAMKLTGKEPDDLTILVGGIEMPIISAKIIRTLDTCVDGWSARIPWTPGDNKDIDKVTRPYGYERGSAYIGNALQVNGYLYTVSPEMTDKGMSKELHGYSFTANAVDSSAPPPYEINNNTLPQIAKYYCNLIGIDAVFQWDSGGKFDRATIRPGETIFQFLSRLSAQRGGLVSCLPTGDMLFTQANPDQKPVGTVSEENPFALGWKATYDGRKRFHAYRCITAGIKGRSATGPLIAALGGGAAKKTAAPTVVEFDKAVPIFRFQTFHADNVTPGNVAQAARWRRNKQFVDTLTLPLPVVGWYAPNGTLWTPNTTLTVISKTLGVGKGFTFIIRSVEFDYSDKKRTAMLHLVPPHAYTGKEVGDIWTY